MDHFHSPRNAGRMERPDLEGRTGSSDHPPYMILQLRLDGDRVAEARFQTYGCGVAIACGSATTELIVGRRIVDCQSLLPQHIADKLDGLPEDRAWCAELALKAVNDALHQWESRTP